MITREDPYYVVLHPDTFVSPSNVSEWVDCSRKSVLAGRTKFSLHTGSDTDFESDLYRTRGTFFHNLLENCLKKGEIDRKALENEIGNVIRDNIPMLWANRMTDQQMAKLLEAKLDVICLWAKTHLDINGDNRPVPISRGGSGVTISKILAIEEELWSPMFGLKGRADATVEVGGEALPLEFKSGKPKNSYSAQLCLYVLMMSDRYQRKISRGLLLTLGGGESI